VGVGVRKKTKKKEKGRERENVECTSKGAMDPFFVCSLLSLSLSLCPSLFMTVTFGPPFLAGRGEDIEKPRSIIAQKVDTHCYSTQIRGPRPFEADVESCSVSRPRFALLAFRCAAKVFLSLSDSM
jgi:hypothetical protein